MDRSHLLNPVNIYLGCKEWKTNDCHLLHESRLLYRFMQTSTLILVFFSSPLPLKTVPCSSHEVKYIFDKFLISINLAVQIAAKS